MARALKILVATDGTPSSEAAIETVLRFPWPERSRVQTVVALRGQYAGLGPKRLAEAVERSLREAGTEAGNLLASRWSEAPVVAVNKPPIDAILREAARFDADVIALGWDGEGAARRLLAGNVSRAIAMRSQRSVLVARSAPKEVKRFVVGYDAGENARSAVKLLARLEAARGMRAILVNAVGEVSVPPRTSRLPSGIQSGIRRDIQAINAQRMKKAKAAMTAAARRLRRAGWATETDIRTGSALDALLSAARDHDADVLVAGACETGGLRRMLIGSVAQGVMNHSPIPVLIVR
jgi:nucleotide-binding universal stress UspA family protein